VPDSARGIGGTDDERQPETEPGAEPLRRAVTEPIRWVPSGGWMDPDIAEWIDRDPERRGA
jgi:hypothetical protein